MACITQAIAAEYGYVTCSSSDGDHAEGTLDSFDSLRPCVSNHLCKCHLSPHYWLASFSANSPTEVLLTKPACWTKRQRPLLGPYLEGPPCLRYRLQASAP